jgi:hypothetical protein
LANSARGVWRSGFGFSACSSSPKFWPNDTRREFANSILPLSMLNLGHAESLAIGFAMNLILTAWMACTLVAVADMGPPA